MKRKEMLADKSTFVDCYDVNYNSATGETVETYVRQGVVKVDTLKTLGWSIPGFHSKVRRGELLPHTPFEQFRQKSISHAGVYDYTWWADSSHKDYLGYRCAPFWSAPNAGFFMATRNECLSYCRDAKIFVSEAAAKIYSSGFDALTFLAEITSVHKMFRDLVKKIIRLDWPRNWRSVSCDWLSWRYGWRTLIMDLQDLNKAISNLNAGRTRYSEKCGTMYRTTDFSSNEYAVSNRHTYIDQIDDRISISLVGSVTADIEVPEFQFNPLTTAWELIPFSFVIDWLISIGTTISSWSFLATQSAYTASCGYKIEITRTRSRSLGQTLDAWRSGTVQMEHAGTSTLEVRTPCSVPLKPHYLLKMNGFKVLDLLALIIQRKGK